MRKGQHGAVLKQVGFKFHFYNFWNFPRLLFLFSIVICCDSFSVRIKSYNKLDVVFQNIEDVWKYKFELHWRDFKLRTKISFGRWSTYGFGSSRKSNFVWLQSRIWFCKMLHWQHHFLYNLSLYIFYRIDAWKLKTFVMNKS